MGGYLRNQSGKYFRNDSGIRNYLRIIEDKLKKNPGNLKEEFQKAQILRKSISLTPERWLRWGGEIDN